MSDDTASTYRSIDISRQLDATYAAWRSGVLTDEEWEARSEPLRQQLHAAAAAEYEQAVADEPGLRAIDVPVVVAGELIESAWGNMVRADLLELYSGKVAKTGDTMTGALGTTAVNVTPGGVTSAGSVAVNAGNVNVTAGDVNVHLGGRVTVGDNPTAGQGGLVSGAGQLMCAYQNDLTGPNLYARRVGPAAAVGGQFGRFLTGASTIIGTITVATASSVAYNTTSDRRLKSLTRPVDPDEAVAKIAALAPVNYTWIAHPEDGEQTGFFAQDVLPYAPEAVAVGTGEPGDEDFVPWGMDESKLVPTLVAAIQALARRIHDLEEATS